MKHMLQFQNIQILLFVSIAVLLLSGCLPVVRQWNSLPENAPEQFAKAIDCRGEVLLIPLIPSGDEILLGDPLVTRYPFENLREQAFSSYEVGLVSVMWGLGAARHISAFLLICSDGAFYDIDVDDMPDEADSDMCFYRAALSQEWLSDFLHVATQPEWSIKQAPWVEGFWCLKSLRGLNLSKIRWEHPESALPIMTRFLQEYSLSGDAEYGAWQHFWRPRFTPNVFCEKHLHILSSFTADEVLLCRDELRKEKYIHPYDKSVTEFEERHLSLNTGSSAYFAYAIAGMVKEALDSGKYKLIAYLPAISEEEKGNVDPERGGNLHAALLRRLAQQYELPFVIVSPVEPDKDAPNYPGIPSGLRQYWQCMQCIDNKDFRN